MNLDFIILPKTLTFITTFSCTATCKDCCFKCSPTRNERLDPNDMKNFINQVVNLYPSVEVLVLTGGETFLLGKDLEKIVEHASCMGLSVRIVTNGYWAKNYNTAFKKLKNLIDKGLKEVNFSTGDDHLEFVPYDNIVNGVKSAMELGLTTVINIESGADRIFKSELLLNNPDIKKYLAPEYKGTNPLQVINSVWMPFRKSTREKQLSKKEGNERLITASRRCTSLFENITINPNYKMMACCGLTSLYSEYLNLGDVRFSSLKKLYERQFTDFLKIWLYVDGPYHIMDFISKITGKDNYFEPDTHVCQICESLLNSKENIEIIKNNYKKVYSDVIFRYLLNKKNSYYESI